MDLLPKKVREYSSILKELSNFLWRPREFVRRSLNGEGSLPSPVELILGTIAICLIVFAVQAKVFAGLMEDLRSELYTKQERAANERRLESRPKEATRFELYEVDWLFPASFTVKLGSDVVRVVYPSPCAPSFTFPESSYVPFDRPQLAVIGAGCSRFLLYNATPNKMLNAASATAFVIAFSLITALSLGPVFYILGYRPPMTRQIAVTSLWYCSSILLFLLVGFLFNTSANLAIAAGASAFNVYSYSFAIAVSIIALFVALRSFFCAYSELYGVGKLKILIFLIVAFALTGVIGPLIMVPTLYMINELGQLIEQLI